MNVYAAQKFIVKLIVMLLAVIAVLVFVNSAYALTDTSHPTYTGGSECHAYNTPTGVIVPVYDYCQNSHAISQDAHKNRSQRPVVTNSHSVQSGQDVPNVPDNDPAKHNNGNHYGNDKGDFNCKDVKNKHNTCK